MKSGDYLIYDCYHERCDGVLTFGDTYILDNPFPDGQLTLWNEIGVFPAEAFSAAHSSFTGGKKIMEIVLSHKDTGSFDEIALDKKAARAVFDRASKNYHNQLSSLLRSEKALWDHINEAYSLDPEIAYRGKYDIKRRRFVIEEVPEESA